MPPVRSEEGGPVGRLETEHEGRAARRTVGNPGGIDRHDHEGDGRTMKLWFRRKRISHQKVCTECGKPTARESRMCLACEREAARRDLDAQRGFSVDLAGYVHVPPVLMPPDAAGDGAGGPLHD